MFKEGVRSFGKLKDLLLETLDGCGTQRIDTVTREHFVQGLRLLEAGDENGVAELEEGLKLSFIADRAKLRRMVVSVIDAYKKLHPGRRKVYDIAIIVAKSDPELRAVLNLRPLKDWEEFNLDHDSDPQVYHRAEWGSVARPLSVVAAAQSQIGVVSAAILATKMILQWSPDYLVMVGIAAGYQGNYGDILVPSRVFLHNSGKVTRAKLSLTPVGLISIQL